MPPVPPDNYEDARKQMVRRQLAGRGITDPRVLSAMEQVPRHRFVPDDLQGSAYNDSPLPIGLGQTISQPYIVAFMTQMLLLTPESKVLEIGTGSGYQTAVLCRLADQVYSIEYVDALAERSRQILADLGCHNVNLRVGDGTQGWPEAAPYDGIIVTAAAPDIPPPLIDQLADGGSLVIPVGPAGYQRLMRLRRQGNEIIRENLTSVAFVPLLGSHGWKPEDFQRW
jgi:protein-L-isoaspartate(D-aspartate) O-methyltransferase